MVKRLGSLGKIKGEHFEKNRNIHFHDSVLRIMDDMGSFCYAYTEEYILKYDILIK